MRILHTSDWHLGKAFNNDIDILDMQEEFGRWLLGVVTEQAIDVVVVAGDIYQRADPPQRAVTLWWSIAEALDAAGVKVVGISGNHDSGERVGGGERILSRQGITLRGDPTRVAEPVCISDEHGEVQFFPVPFLQPFLTGAILEVPEGQRNHESVLRAAVNKVNAVKHAGRTVLIAHAFVAGGETSESEYELVGGTEHVSPELFNGFTYTALGHLHTHQAWEGGHIAYSGSPLPYSFSETASKCVRIITLNATGISNIEVLPCPIGRKVKTLQATFAELHTNTEYSEFEDHFIFAKPTDKAIIPNAQEILQQRFPHLCRLQWVSLENVQLKKAERGATNNEKIKNFLTEVLGDRLTDNHLALALNELSLAQQGDTN